MVRTRIARVEVSECGICPHAEKWDSDELPKCPFLQKRVQANRIHKDCPLALPGTMARMFDDLGTFKPKEPLKAGDKVTWSYKSGGKRFTRTGVILHVLPPATEVPMSLMSGYKCKFRKYVTWRNRTHYLVSSNGELFHPLTVKKESNEANNES